MVAIGNLIGYGVGTIDLVKVFGKTLGDTQFKQLCVISAAALLAAVGITSYSVQERILIAERSVMVELLHMPKMLMYCTLQWPSPKKGRHKRILANNKDSYTTSPRHTGYLLDSILVMDR